jgi:[ribosomal protein S5]-alanine N-acetyltransferase
LSGTGRSERIETPRLTLLPATIPLLRAEGEHVGNLLRSKLEDWEEIVSMDPNSPRGEFEALLGAEVATPWPPPSNDEHSRQRMIGHLEGHPEPGWGVWYILLKRGPGERAIVVGNGGFKGPPSADGTVEIGYSVVEGYQRLGIASEAVRALMEHAFENPRVRRVKAEALADNVTSIRVLEKNGFRSVGSGSEPGSVLLERLPETTP